MSEGEFISVVDTTEIEDFGMLEMSVDGALGFISVATSCCTSCSNAA